MNRTLIEDRLVSVIIPSYKRYSMLKEAIKSVLSQTYNNFELIIVLDSYPDSKVNNLSLLFNKDKRLKLLKGNKLGGAKARNIGIDSARGDYIAFLDDDDLWKKTKLEEQVKCFNNNPNAILVYCDINLKYEDKLIPVKKKEKVILEDLLLNNFIGSFSFVMIKKTQLRINPNMRSLQDWYLWLKIMEKNRDKYCVNTNTILVDYAMHNQGKISSSNENVIAGHKLFYESFEHLFSSYLKSFHKFRILKKINKNKMYFKLFLKSLAFMFLNLLKIRENFLLFKILNSKEKR